MPWLEWAASKERIKFEEFKFAETITLVEFLRKDLEVLSL